MDLLITNQLLCQLSYVGEGATVYHQTTSPRKARMPLMRLRP